MSAVSPPGPSDTLPAALGPATAALPEVLPAPSFDELGKLAAVAAIRIVLNFFLSREIAEEQRIIAARGDRDRPDPAPAPPGPVPESR